MSVDGLLARLRDLNVNLLLESDELRISAPNGVLDDELRAELVDNKAEIISTLRSVKEAKLENTMAIERVTARDDYPLTRAQERLWLVARFAEDTSIYNLSIFFRLTGELNPDALERALNEIVNRHDSLRTTFVTVNGQPRQRVAHQLTNYLHRIDLRHLQDSKKEQELQQRIRTASKQAFDLELGPLIRTNLFWMDVEEHVLQINMHHIISDGWSLGVLFRELGELYHQYASGRDASLPELTVQYTDYAVWEKTWLADEIVENQLDYWRTQLKNLPVLMLPADYPRPPVQTYRGADIVLNLASDVRERLEALSRDQGCTLYITLLSAFNLLLHKYCGQNDIVVGTPVANRKKAELETLIGFFVNMLVVRTDVSGDPTFCELMKRVKNVTLEAHDHQDVPFEKLVEEIQPERDLSRNPLFQVVFSLQNAPLRSFNVKGLSLSGISNKIETTRFDFEAHISQVKDGLAIRFVYNSDLFEASIVSRMLDHYAKILSSVAATADKPLSQLNLLSEQEQHYLLEELNRTETDYPRSQTVHELFERQVLETPDAIAVDYEGDRLSYAQLNQRANQLANYLQSRGVGPEVMTGICLERSLEMVVGLLGILKSGGAYLPLDPDYPQSRLAFMLEDACVPVLLSRSTLVERLPKFDGILVCLDKDWAEIENENTSNPVSAVTAASLMYVIYTSGSTGRPKGTLIEHRSAVRLVKQTNYVELGSDEVFLQFAPISFDASTFELWGSLLNGAKLIIFPAGPFSLEELGRFIHEKGITTLWLTSALFNQMVDKHLGSLAGVRQLLAGGEALSLPQVRQMLKNLDGRRLINGYGPTENTTFTCCHVMTSASNPEQSVPIGRPISNTTVYILDEQMRPVPVGVHGELYIGGDGLARGYLNQPELTAEKFIANPFSGRTDDRLYKTGDRVRYRSDGAIEFLGRFDHQVKIRGYRIELGEIETVLANYEVVHQAVVVLRENEPGDKKLVAYVVAAANHSLHVDDLQSFLLESLPAYMVPAAFVFLDELPLTANGKVDKGALPEPDVGAHLQASYIAPRNELESKISAIWKQVLNVEQVGIHDNFFSLGGNSLLLAEVHEKIQAVLGNRFAILELFKYPTISALASHLSGEKHVTDKDLPDTRNYLKQEVRAGGDIAIIGMSGRFPGAKDVETFWDNLCNGVESITFFSDEELRQAGVAEALLKQPEYVKAVSCLDDVDMFDAKFFNYSPRQAQVINPQQRLFLECAWEVLERAGYDSDRFQGQVAVYGGVSSNHYDSVLVNNPELAKSYNHLDTFMGNDKDFLATRVSYNLNLKGPGITLQTACSTSLVAVHLAVQSLHQGDCDMAIAGGAAIRSFDSKGYKFEEGGILSPDGHCRAFDAKANGTISGDGTAVVLLKRLDDALADGDQIYAVIRGSAINNDGSQKIGYTAPAVQGQAEVIAKAQARAEVDPRSISYIEAHGTGTPLGDPIEIEALTQVFQKKTPDKNFCAIGSLKSNIGHLDSAAGVASLIKTTMALWQQKIPPSLNFESPNPQIDFENNPFVVNTELMPWNRGGTPRRAGVSSFGIGGTNAHLILEEAPSIEPSSEARPWQLLVLSAKTASALETMTDNLAACLQSGPESNFADLAYTLQLGRKAFSHRRSVVCRDLADAISALEGRDSRRVIDSLVQDSDRSIVFMFTGQGSQYPGMGLELYRHHSRYREIVDQCCDILHAQLGFDLREILFPSQAEGTRVESRLHQTEITQAALFVTEYALAGLWMSWGITPTAMIGHSIGEYVAACLSGVMSLEAVLEIVATRGRLMGQLPQGSMMAVPISEAELGSRLIQGLEVASVNGPQMCVVSGTDQAIDAFAEILDNDGIQPQKLHTSHAFHSAMMDPVVEPFKNCVSRFELNAPLIPYISNVTGTWITEDEASSADYYSRHLRSAVRFSDGLGQLLAKPECLLLEIGPGHTLASLAKYHPAKRDDQVIVSSLRHATENLSDEAVMWRAIGNLWLAGVVLDWSAMHSSERRHKILLPSYPFERQRYWLEQEPQRKLRPRQSLRRNNDTREWIYVPSWRRAPLRSGLANPATVSWLLFGDEHELGEQTARDLENRNAEVIRVRMGDRFSQLSEKQFVIDPGRQEDYQQLVRELDSQAGLPANIAHMWSLSKGQPDLADRDSMMASLDLGFYSLLYLTQAIEKQQISDPVQLVVVTSSAHQVSGNDNLQPATAMALGPCKVIGMEHPHISCRNIDVEAVSDRQDHSQLGRILAIELLAPCDEPVVAYRGNCRWVQSYESLQIAQSENKDEIPRSPSLFNDSGVYIITGGLGGLGMEMAGYIARTVGVRLVLVSRSGLPERGSWQQWLAEHGHENNVSSRIKRVQALEDAGAEVLVCKADVTNEEQMAEVFSSAENQFGSISGVIHSAGASKTSAPVCSVTKSFCEQQFKPKLQGLVVLARLVAGREVDFCMVNSSLASVMGVMDFVAYTAAHIFMDTFVLQQSRNPENSVRWLTVNWDNWATEEVVPEKLAPGIAEYLIYPEEGAAALSSAFSLLDTPQVVVSTGDLQSRIDRWQLREAYQDTAANDSETGSRLYQRPALDVEYEAPRNEVERILADIWRDMLGIDKIGIHDNFFELGGDSVLNIQIIARASQSGLKLTPKQVFELQTIAELAAVAKTSQHTDGQNLIDHGAVSLTPVQHWLFEQQLDNPQHFNQAMLFQVTEVLDIDILQQALEILLTRHAALRARYTQDQSGWKQRIDETCNIPEVQCFDLSGLSAEDQKQSIGIQAGQIHRSLDLVQGPLLRVAYFDLGSGKPGRLLIVIHHLVVDVVSWRILMEDLQSAYRQLLDGVIVELPEQTTNFKFWSEQLTDYARNTIPVNEIHYWESLTAKQADLLPRDMSDGNNDISSVESLNLCLSESETRQLLTVVPRIYKTRTNEILLAALRKTLSDWCETESVSVMLEGHGREAIIEGVDMSRTVGWFTTLFPVWLDCPFDMNIGEQIKAVKEQLRSVPSNGIGFGLLRYLSDRPDIRKAMEKIPLPEIVFLYLGQFEQSSNNNALLQPAPESPGPMQDLGSERQQLIDMTAAISQGQLSVTWIYSRNRHKENTIRMLADNFLKELRAIIEHCGNVKKSDHTPSDFSARGLNQRDLDLITSKLKNKKAGAM